MGKLEWWGYPMVEKNFENMYNRLEQASKHLYLPDTGV